MGLVPVGRKKTRDPDPSRKPVAITIKGDPTWRAWVEAGAKHCQLSVSACVAKALTKYFKSEGFTEKQPERLPENKP